MHLLVVLVFVVVVAIVVHSVSFSIRDSDSQTCVVIRQVAVKEIPYLRKFCDVYVMMVMF